MVKFTPFWDEDLTLSQQKEKIKSLFTISKYQINKNYPDILLRESEWCYLLLPGRISHQIQQKLLSSDLTCLCNYPAIPYAIILPYLTYCEVISDILSSQNDAVYFIAFATQERDHEKLLEWINLIMTSSNHITKTINAKQKFTAFSLLVIDSGDFIENEE